MVNYNTAQLYRIVDKSTGETLIVDTTTEPLAKRFAKLKSRKFVKYQFIDDWSNVLIVLIDSVSCDTKTELTKHKVNYCIDNKIKLR
jgi:hypothetical protein